MKITVETDGYVFFKDFGISSEQFGDTSDEFIPPVEDAIFSACYLIGKVYTDRLVKEILPLVAKDY